jgi:hypothetical protein
MQKVYRLLRNNQETGPYTLDEILQLNLKPFDLVWVEGRSAAWRYPSEIETLKAFVPAAAQPPTPFEPVATAAMEKDFSTFVPENPQREIGKKVFVSMPGNPSQPLAKVEQPQATPDRHAAYLPKEGSHTANTPPPSTPVPEGELFQTNYNRSLNEVEEDYTSWVYRQKTKKKSTVSKKDMAIAAVIVLLIVGGYFVISKPSVIQPLTQQRTSAPATQQPAEETVQQNQPAGGEAASSLPPAKTEKKKQSSTNSKVLPPERKNDHTEQSEIQTPDNGVVAGNEDIAKTNSEPQKAPPVTDNKGKKKKLGEVIRGIFNKKEKQEEPKEETVMEAPKPATNRQATKRNETTEDESEADNAALAEMVDVFSNAPDNWMMGVTGLKVTLRNRNNVALQTAAVQVLYYDDNNELLDKKSIYFSNVPAKGRATMPAPDHKFADHVTFKVLAVTPKADQYVRN